MPSWQELSTFLVSRIHALEAVEPKDLLSKPNRNHSANNFRKNLRSNLVNVVKDKAQKRCPLCNEFHYIGYCKGFKIKSPQQRKEDAIRLNLCLICLRKHPSSERPSPHRCSICKDQHHSLLYQELPTSSASPKPPVLSTYSSIFSTSYTLLATVLIRVQCSNGRSAVVRTLLDQGSEATFISENLAQYLRLPRTKVTVPVVGMGATDCGTAKSVVRVQLSSTLKGYNTVLNAAAFVLPNLLKTFQPRRIDKNHWSHLQSLAFSDTQPDKSMNIEFVIGADQYGYALLESLVKGSPGTPVAQHTIFGWVLSGTINDSAPKDPQLAVKTMHCSVDLSLSNDLRRFWEIEEILVKRLLTPEDEFCEQHFQNTHLRDSDGKFIVRLPRRSNVPLGDSYCLVCRSFYRNEHQRQKNQALNSAYRTFMEEYVALGHMKPISGKPRADNFYLPHHAVWKQEGTNSKIRVVFNASARSTSGNSLNDSLLPGPKLQSNLSHIILKWRTYPIVFSADIVKMFRQIWVLQDDQPLQQILWRNAMDEDLQEFQLKTVTYGTACAPFFAIRCLHQLTEEEHHRFPEAAEVVRHQMYVDDILSGADTLEHAIELRTQLQSLLMAGGFQLAKWSSNSPNFAENAGSLDLVHSLADGSIKTLGSIGILTQTNSDSK